jgi:hypothetical protein
MVKYVSYVSIRLIFDVKKGVVRGDAVVLDVTKVGLLSVWRIMTGIKKPTFNEEGGLGANSLSEES